MKPTHIFGLYVLAAIVAVGVTVQLNSKPKEKESTITPQQQSAADRCKLPVRLFTAEGGHIAVVEKIRSKMNDPESFQHIVTTSGLPENGERKGLCVFRGRNSFNALIKSRAWFTLSEDGTTVKKLKIE